MLTHLPILQVIVPLLAAPSCLLLDRARLAWLFSVATSALSTLISLLLLLQVSRTGVISYALGGWQAPWGIEYRIDPLNAYLLVIVSSLGTVVLGAAYRSVEREVGQNQVLFYVVYLLCFAGLLGIVATGDAFNIFVFLEIASLSTYTLVSLGNNRRALRAAYQYLIVGTIGATFILIGIGFLYMVTGTLNIYDLSQRLPNVAASATVVTAFAFIVVGLCLKLALFPLHLWLPDAYTYSSSIVTAFLAATSTKVAVYLLIRFIYSVFGVEFSSTVMPLFPILLGLGVAGVLAASLVAIYQVNIKRLFAYSSVAQVAYMAIGIGIGSAVGLQAALLHLFNHALIKGLLFLAIAGIVYRTGTAEISALRGLGRQMPWTAAAIVAGSLSLIGVPLTVGFVSKWYLLLAAMESQLWPLACLVVAGSVLAVIYVWKVIDALYFKDPGTQQASGSVNHRGGEAPLSLLIPTWMLLLANLYFGIDTRPTVAVSEQASHYLLGGMP